MPALVRGCLESDFDAVTGACAQEIWILQQTVIPALSVEGAQAVAVAIASLWALAFVFRRLRKFIDQA